MHERHPLVRLLARPAVRRTLLVPAALLMGLAAVSLATSCLPLAAAGDLVRRRWRMPWLRATAFVLIYGLAEALGLLGLGVVWALWRRSPAYVDRNVALARAWAGGLFAAFRALFSLRLEIEGAEALEGGPLLVFPRHVSLADTLLPMVLSPPGQRPRYVMKAALRLDPILDLLGERTPNAFVERDTGAPGAQIARVAKLAEGLGAGDFVVLFPEGTRFTPGRRTRQIARLEARGATERLALARSLRWVLSPHTGGALALMAAAPEADVVFFAHTGLEGLTHLRDLFDGAMIGGHVRVRLERVPATDIPQADRRAWLFARWRKLDRWLDAAGSEAVYESARRAGGKAQPRPPAHRDRVGKPASSGRWRSQPSRGLRSEVRPNAQERPNRQV